MPNVKIKLAIVGVGKIVVDQHLPAIANTDLFEIVATASPEGQIDGVVSFASIQELFASGIDLEAVALCMPPQYRYEAACCALDNGKHVLLEKPPGATVSEVIELQSLAHQRGLSLFTAWHSRYAPAVELAKETLASRGLSIDSVVVNWKENVSKWHPGQEWIWQPGGQGVFDPGINGLSILTEIMPRACILKSAVLEFPANRMTPIAAKMSIYSENAMEKEQKDEAISSRQSMSIEVDLDWRVKSDEEWSILLSTSRGEVHLFDGGAGLIINGQKQAITVGSPSAEYEAIYCQFAELISSGQSQVDIAPFTLVADAFLLGARTTVAPFDEM